MKDDISGPPPDPLSERQIEILRRVAEGLSDREIAQELFVSLNTIKWHNKQIYRKLGVDNRTQAVVQAKDLGLLKIEPDLAAHKHNLPAQATLLFGREREMAQVGQLLTDARLMTLTGPGGIGKTRLALEVAARQIDAFRDGVYFVSLAPLSSTEAIVQTVVETLGQSFLTSGDLKAHLLHYLRNKEMLLVMDNFEHLLDGALLLGEMVESAPDVRILVTSREKLKLRIETVFVTPGLSFPSIEVSEADELEYSSVKLFSERAQQLRPDFVPAVDDVFHIARICRMVQGMPLAVELAAAWVDTLSCVEIATEIARNLDVLATELRDVPPRQRSIRAVFDHSWNLTPAVERDVFLKLSVFRGGFTREAADLVAGASLPVLASLVDKSLLTWELGTRRYEVHELLRQYAQERLDQRPEASVSAQEAHAAYYADFMHERWEYLRDSRQIVALDEIVADLENVRRAWRYRVNQANAAQMGMFIHGFRTVYFVRGWMHAGEEVGRQAVEALREAASDDEEAEVVLAMALAYQAKFMAWLGLSGQGYDLVKESVEILERLNQPAELANALDSLHLVAYYLARYDEEEEAGRKIFEIATELDDEWLLAYSLILMGMIAFRQEDYGEARRLTETSLAGLEELGDAISSTFAQLVLGHVFFALGDYAQANGYFRRCLSMSIEMGFRWAIVNATQYLGRVALSRGEIVEARAYFLRSLKIAEEIGLGREIAYLLYNLAMVRVAEDRSERAVELLALLLRHPASQHGRLDGGRIRDSVQDLHGRLDGGRIRDSVQDLLVTLEAELSPETYAAAWERGQALDIEQVVNEFVN
jgi:predicted ATPase/DNA-binding CsgD family transcriptional regulator